MSVSVPLQSRPLKNVRPVVVPSVAKIFCTPIKPNCPQITAALSRSKSVLHIAAVVLTPLDSVSRSTLPAQGK